MAPVRTDENSIPLDFDFNTLHKLFLPGNDRPHGFILPATAAKIPWTADFTVTPSDGTIRLTAPPGTSDLGAFANAAFQNVVDAIVSAGPAFPSVNGRHSEKFLVMGAPYHLGIERFAAPLFGITSRGAHMTGYAAAPDGLRVWVPRRSAHLFTYPGMLDTTVAGGVKAEDSPLECIVAEASEEASLPEDYVRAHARAVGAVTYAQRNEARGSVLPTVLYVYDLPMPETMVPRPMDDEVESFVLMTVDEVYEAIFKGEFKPNCVLVMLDFFIRHGVLTAGNCPEYLDILTRIRRRLPVPTSPVGGGLAA